MKNISTKKPPEKIITNFPDFITELQSIDYIKNNINLRNASKIEILETVKELYFKVKKDDFLKLLLTPGPIEVGMMSADGQKNITTEKITVLGAYWITKEVDGKDEVFNAVEFGKELNKDKEKIEKLNKQLVKVAQIPTIINMINGSDASKVEITRAK